MDLDNMKFNANSNQSQPDTNETSAKNNQTNAQSDLRSTMEQMMSNKPQESSDVNTDKSESTTTSFNDIMNTDWFKSMPAEQRAMLMAGKSADTEMDDLDAAVAQGQSDALAEINALRKEEGKEELDKKDFDALKDAKFIDSDNGRANFLIGDDEFAQLLKEADPESDEEDAVVTKEMKTFEEYISSAIDISPTNSNYNEDGEQSKSAALLVKIKRSKEYEDIVKGVLESNDIKFKTSKKGNLKQAILRGFVQRNNHITVPLINSGIYVTLSGASIPEIIQMNNIKYSSKVEYEFKKMQFVWKHLVDTSIGKISSIQEFMKIIHFRDMDTLFYALYVGTFPDITDYPTFCQNKQCQQSLSLRLHSSDLVLNADEFTEISNYIMYENTNVSNLLEKSALSKEKRLTLSNNIVLNIKNLSVYDYISSMSRIEKFFSVKNRNTEDYSMIIGMMYFIEYVALPAGDGTFIKYTDPDDISEILLALGEDDTDTLTDEIDSFMGKNLIKYGLKAHICPKCRQVHKDREVNMDQFLFTLVNMKMVVKQIQKQKKKEELKGIK